MKYENDFARHGLFDARVPRYTSYPPANRFAARDPEPGWMEAVPPGRALSFYLHIPFCRRLCWFCACRTQGTKTDAPVEGYVDRLIREIDTVAGRLPAATAAQRLHIGGGTPTLLSPALTDRLLAAFRSRFLLVPGGEFSVEIDPTDCDRARLETLARHGLNRASLGVQDFDPRVQDAIGRHQSWEVTQACIADLRDLGVPNINLDILYGLPHQTETTLNATLDKVLALDPDRIAAFGYAHVPWMSKRQALIPTEALPDPRARLALMDVIARRLQRAGYVQIGIDHFAKPRDGLARAMARHALHRNFQGYTDDASPWLIGLGASAISRYPQGYLQNATSTADYARRVQEGQLPTRRGIAMDAASQLTARLIEDVMCYGRIELDRLPEAAQAQVAPRLAMLARRFDPLVSFTGRYLHVDRAAYPLLRVIAAALDETPPPEGAHALAV